MSLQPRYFFAVPGVVPGRFQEKGQFPQNGMVDDVDEGLGGDANAYTAFDETVYMMDVPSMKESTVDLAFTIMRDFADGALLEESAIDAERGIITSEYKVRDSAGYRVMKEVFSIMLDGTRIPDRYPIGTLEVIRTAPRELSDPLRSRPNAARHRRGHHTGTGKSLGGKVFWLHEEGQLLLPDGPGHA